MTPNAIRRMRKKLGLTVRQLAAQVGVSHVSIVHWESGSRKPREVCLRALRLIAKGKHDTR